MADDLSSLAQQIAFYQSGGQAPGTSNADRFNQGFDLVNKVVGTVLAQKKAMLENKKASLEQSPIGNYFGVPSAKEQASQNQAITGRNSTKVPENIYPQPTSESENAKLPTSSYIPASSLESPVNSRAQFQQDNKISPDTPMFLIPEAIKVAALQGQIPMFINDVTGDVSFDPKSIFKGYHPFTSLKGSQAATVASTQAAAVKPTPVITEAEGLAQTEAGTPPPKSTRLVHPKTEEALPTYKKSELLAMSPEERAGLGKYKMVDDTTPNKNTDDNQTIDSILSGIDRLNQIRSTMGSGARMAATTPGVAQIGKLMSAPLASWETEKNLLAQRLGKLVEKNRMSDEDRNFYLRQFSSPVANDAAFAANIAGLRTSIEAMKKSGVSSGASTVDNDPLGIR